MRVSDSTSVDIFLENRAVSEAVPDDERCVKPTANNEPFLGSLYIQIYKCIV